MTQFKEDIYNDFASQYERLVIAREQAGVERDPIMPQFLNLIGDPSGLTILDACCGEGYLSRILARDDNHITGIDIAPRLIEIARTKDPESKITYLVADLSQPIETYQQHFDLIVSHLALNDVYAYQSLFTTLASFIRPGGRLVFSMNNPYSYLVRGSVTNYFDSGQAFLYGGMAQEGVKVHFYQRTLQEYLDAAFAAGLRLQRLIDLPMHEGMFKRRATTWLPEGHHFPFFMLLSFVKP
jgi:2-polyprenyl-3-methyl-5-hydroxy-6-metoxy-1,4-benzoquinol methylase